jgi:hypothetical protein
LEKFRCFDKLIAIFFDFSLFIIEVESFVVMSWEEDEELEVD